MAVHSARRHAVVGVSDQYLLSFMTQGALLDALRYQKVYSGLPPDTRIEACFHEQRMCWFVVSSEHFTDEQMQDDIDMLGLPMVRIEVRGNS